MAVVIAVVAVMVVAVMVAVVLVVVLVVAVVVVTVEVGRRDQLELMEQTVQWDQLVQQEQTVQWGRQVQQERMVAAGPAGPAGADGAVGPAGPAGGAGGLTTTTNFGTCSYADLTIYEHGSVNSGVCSLSCGEDEVLVGGGCRVGGTGNGVLTTNQPSGNQWECDFVNLGSDTKHQILTLKLQQFVLVNNEGS